MIANSIDSSYVSKDNCIYQCVSHPYEGIQSIATVGNVSIYLTKHFNWIQKIFWKLLFGVEISDYE